MASFQQPKAVPLSGQDLFDELIFGDEVGEENATLSDSFREIEIASSKLPISLPASDIKRIGTSNVSIR